MSESGVLLLVAGPFIAVVSCSFFFWVCSKWMQASDARRLMHANSFPEVEACVDMKLQAPDKSYRLVLNPAGSFFLGAAKAAEKDQISDTATSEGSSSEQLALEKDADQGEQNTMFSFTHPSGGSPRETGEEVLHSAARNLQRPVLESISTQTVGTNGE